MTDIIKQEIDDLRLFADPFEDFSCNPDESEKKWVARLIRKGRELTLVRSPEGRIDLRPRGGTPKKFRDFRALLVSETFANLERLAMALRYQVLPTVCDSKGIPKNFINSRGAINIDGHKHEDLSFDSVSKLLNKRDENLRVIVIDGVAGVGKTLLIRRIVYDRSQPGSYKSENPLPLLLHVESLGKVLTALNDRIAGTLSNLRADFVEDELKPLIRRGLIQLAIDGFDELSDNRGYETAWGALKDFLRDLDGKGTCILAGRDTMLNERTVREGLDTSIGDRPLTFVTLQGPEPNDIESWLSHNRNWSRDREALGQIKRQAQQIEYIKRPFFVSLVSELGPDKFKESGGEPIVDLMNHMILRESEKIVPNSVEVDINRVGELYTEILAEVARTMMDDETDSIEVDLLALIIEEAFTGELNKEAVEAIKNRAGTLAMLEQNKADSNSRVFPHDAIKSYFFSKSLVDHFPKHDGPPNALFRVPLHVEDLNIFNRVVRGRDLQKQHILRDKLFEALSKSSIGYIRSNIGGLLLSFLPLENDEIEYEKNFVIAHLNMQDAWMGEHTDSQRGKLFNCHISRLDVRGADLSGVEFQDVIVNELLVDNFVKFGETAPDVKSSLTMDLRYSSAGANAGMKSEFNPNEIKDWISGRSYKRATRIVPDPRWNILEKFARISMRQYWLRTSDIEAKKLMRSQHWGDLVRLLKQHDRLQETSSKHAAGPSSIWLHLVDGREFLSFGEQEYSIRPSTQEILQELGVLQ